MRKILVYGASGHGKVVAEILTARNESGFVGFVDDRAELHGMHILNFPVLGSGKWLQQEAAGTQVAVALGVGDNRVRKMLAERCASWGIELITVVHPSSSVSVSAQLGRGIVVMAQAAINAEAQIGDGVIVNTGAVIEHDTEIGDFAHVAPNATMGGASRLGRLSLLGIGATVIQGVRIGDESIVGAGAVVVRDIPDNVIAFGVPARVQGICDIDSSKPSLRRMETRKC